MKRFFIMLAAVVLTATTLSAQIVPGMKYRDLKNMYNPRQYVRNAADPYSKGWSAVASAVVPGLGQMICKETGRGIGILAGDVALGVAGHVCASKFNDYLAKDANGKYVKENGPLPARCYREKNTERRAAFRVFQVVLSVRVGDAAGAGAVV